MKKKIILSFIVIGLAFLVYKFFSLSDIKPKTSKYPNSYKKAKEVLKEMGEAHNIQFWNNIETYNVTFEDEFYGFLGSQSHPFKEQKVILSLSYMPKENNGQLKFLSGKDKGTLWGIQSGQVYEKSEGGDVVLNENKDMIFWIPTYQYFIEFPIRIQEATALEYLGFKTINDIEAEGVLASWGTVNAQKDIDQYMIWVNAKTKRIIKIDYTIREMNNFSSGTAYFNDYMNYGGLLLPAQLPVESNLKKGYLHKMKIVDFKSDLFSKNTLLPLH